MNEWIQPNEKRKEYFLRNEKNHALETKRTLSQMKRTPPQNQKEQRLEGMNQMNKKGTEKKKSNIMKTKATKRYGEEWLVQ